MTNSNMASSFQENRMNDSEMLTKNKEIRILSALKNALNTCSLPEGNNVGKMLEFIEERGENRHLFITEPDQEMFDDIKNPRIEEGEVVLSPEEDRKFIDNVCSIMNEYGLTIEGVEQAIDKTRYDLKYNVETLIQRGGDSFAEPE